MQEQHGHGSGLCLTSLVIGAVAGAGIALLMTPRSGRETRDALSGKVREGAEHARDVASRAMERGRRLAEAAAEKGRGAPSGIVQEGAEEKPALSDYASAADFRGL